MDFPAPLIPAVLTRRYKRFLADAVLEDGAEITAHCPNTGAMLGCDRPGSRIWLSRSSAPGRKYPLTWELVEARRDILVGINTARPNALVREGIESGRIEELTGYASIRREVRYGRENSRIDLLLEGRDRGPPCYVEVKNVTAAVAAGVALFPDAVSIRGTRHLRELGVQARDEGHRAVLCFCVQRRDVDEVRPADAIDPAYGQALRAAMESGVEVIAYRAEVTPQRVRLVDRIPVVCP